jgi:hypothetical protein
MRSSRAVLRRRSTENYCARAVLVLLGFCALLPQTAHAQIDLGPVTVGAGIRTDFNHLAPDQGPSLDQFQLDNVRLYVSGSVTDQIKFMFNTEYDQTTNKVGVLDAVAEFAFSPEINFWAGRFLPPSDRANLYGPFFANEWAVYQDGVQDGYPFVFQGRDNGAIYWGTFAKKIKVSVGAFDGRTADGIPNVIGAARVQVDFWDPEDGYYLNGTYYGDKKILAIGGATQFQNGHTATTLDFLLDRKIGNGGVVTIESEYSNYNGLGGYDIHYANSQGAYGLGAYMFPKKIGIGKFQLLGKYAKAEYTHGIGTSIGPNYDQKTTEVDVNYIIKQFNARIMTFMENIRFNRVRTDFWQGGIGLQLQI